MAVLNALSDLRRLVSGPNVKAGSRRAKIVAVCAQKGGVGKTTTAVHVAAGLAKFHGLRTLIIDMDAQGHVGTSLGHAAAEGESLSDVLLQKRRDIFEVVSPTEWDGLSVVPSDGELNQTEAIMAGRIGKETLLRTALRVAKTHFDVIVVDCPPNVGSLTVNALVAADYALVPCDLSLLSLDGVNGVVDAVLSVQETLNPTLDLLGLVRTRVDRRNTTVNTKIEALLSEKYGAFLLDTVVGVSTDITKAQLHGRPVFEHSPKSRGAGDYKALVAELVPKLLD